MGVDGFEFKEKGQKPLKIRPLNDNNYQLENLMNRYTLALAGNPNSGKTTLMNAFTGTRHQVGNWPGVTVEKKEGTFTEGDTAWLVVDLPGVYSLSPFTIEERISRDYLLQEKTDVVVNLVDSCNLERNLYLTMQLIEMEIPVVIALNMMDEADRNGISIDPDRLERSLGVPVVPIAAIEERGLDQLLERAKARIGQPAKVLEKPLNYGSDLEGMIRRLGREMEEHHIESQASARWLAIKVLEQDPRIEELVGADKARYLKVESNYSDEIANHRYKHISRVLRDAITNPGTGAYEISDKIDRILLHQWLGIPIFLLIMGLVFKLTFDIGGIFSDALGNFFSGTLSGAVGNAMQASGIAPWLIRLITEGIIGGVGGVLTFLPNIIILFLAISILEDSGYMARAAFLLDEWMQKAGLTGKTFIPMVLGLGCNVPGIMAARTLENENDRLIAILINPFISCGARFPVYILIASAFFHGNEAVVTFSLYVLGVLVALSSAWLFRRFLLKGEETHFIMELPPYRLPKLRFLILHVWDRVKGYLVKAGTVIFAASVILWVLLNFNFSGSTDIAHSFGAGFGRWIAVLFIPLGFGTWQAALSLFSGIVGKEIVVANMAIIYGIGSNPSSGAFYHALSQSFNPVSAYALLVFVLLYTPCVGVIGVMRRETNSWRWPLFSVIYQLVVAWGAAFIAYQVGHLIFR